MYCGAGPGPQDAAVSAAGGIRRRPDERNRVKTTKKDFDMTRDDVMRDTLAHVRRVGSLLGDVLRDLQDRTVNHDASKFSEDEFDAFAATTPKLRGLTYGSEEYRAALREIKPAVELHYSRNRHHPEHFAGGFADMTLVDILEMLADWKAASERHADGDFARSIEQNTKRFGYDETIEALLVRTARYLEWLP